MYKQSVLPLKFSEPVTFDDIKQTETNCYAIKWLKDWPQNRPDINFCYLTGSQNEILSYIWGIQNQARYILTEEILLEYWHKMMNKKLYNKCYLIKLVEKTEEELLLYTLNLIKERRSYLLLTSDIHPNSMQINLPDLRSRLSTIGIFTC